MNISILIRPMLFRPVSAILMMGTAMSCFGQSDVTTYRVTEHVVDSGMVRRTVEYYDGLGRLSQTVRSGYTPDGNDLVEQREYDNVGELSKQWYPVVSSAPTASALETSTVRGMAISQYGDLLPYQSLSYDGSSLNRLTSRHNGGAEWSSSSITYHTNSNSGVLSCRQYVAHGTSITCSGVVPQGELEVVCTTNENGHTMYVFTDLYGQKVLERRQISGTTYADTYYVYDGYGHLCFILPPAASEDLTYTGATWDITTNETLRRYAYYYAYDVKGRRITVKEPGREAVEMVYDMYDRVIFTQDGAQREQEIYTVYGYYRGVLPAIEALVGDARDVEQMRDYYKVRELDATVSGEESSAPYKLSGLGHPLHADSVLTYNFYDHYQFLSKFAVDSDSLSYVEMSGYDKRYSVPGKYPLQPGRLTGRAVRVLNGDGTLGEMLPCALYYDEHGNVIQRRERNAMGGYDISYYHLTRSGLPLREMRVHSTADTTGIVDVLTYSRDHAGRLTSTTMRHAGGTPCVLEQLEYDEYDRIVRRELPESGASVTYTYNLRSLPTGIYGSGNVFRQQLSYYDADLGHNVSNIMRNSWSNTATVYYGKYDYRYDGLNRLTGATYSSQNGGYNYTTTYSYDVQSNLTGITRKGVNSKVSHGSYYNYGFGDIDNLTLTYDGNQLTKVYDTCYDLTYAGAMEFRDGADQSDEYSWDANGRMTRDMNRKITAIAYNAIDLPRRVQYSDGHIVYHTYSADGRKLKTAYAYDRLSMLDEPTDTLIGPISGPVGPLGNGGASAASMNAVGESVSLPDEVVESYREYSGGYTYLNGTLERVETPVGYIHSSGVHLAYLKDYQGNVRAVVADGMAVELDDYYPYGMSMCIPWGDSAFQPMKYGGKELDRANGWDSLDYGARWLMPAVGGWPTPDPLASTTPWLSPYSYCGGDPINRIDPTGMKITFPQSIEFNTRMRDVKNYIGKDDFQQRIDAMRNSPHEFIIQDGSKSLEDDRHFNVHTSNITNDDGEKILRVQISIDLNHALMYRDGSYTSPALAALHELEHGYRIAHDEQGYFRDVDTPDELFYNQEEKRVILEVENPKAIQLGEPVRHDHKYFELKLVENVWDHKVSK